MTVKSKYPPKKTNSHIIKVNPKLNWSEYQKAIFKDAAKGEGHTIVEAYAGSAKTSSVIESFKYLPKGKKTLALAFNKIIQEELRSRAPSYIEALTFHSLGLRAIKQRFGNAIEIDDFKVFNIAKQVADSKDYDLITSICDTVAFCKYSLKDTPPQIDDIIDTYGIDTCEVDRDKFINHVIRTLSADKLLTNKIDFNDMCWFPFVYNLFLGSYDYVYIDERQDLNKSQLIMAKKACKPMGRIIAVGDKYQCVEELTNLYTNSGNISVKDVTVGESILSYENGKSSFKKILNKFKSDWTYGLKVTTNTGKSLIMSPNHRIWAELIDIPKNKMIVYLMYRQNLGFRVGITNKWTSINHNNSPTRASQETADKMWILDIVDSNDNARYLEQYYSLTFGIPTSVFNAEGRGINQDRINLIFEKFGSNGHKILQDKNLSFDYPHWIGPSRFTTNVKRLVVRISSHGNKCSNVNFETSDPITIKILTDDGITGKYYKRRERDTKTNFSVRKQFSKYTNAYDFANKLTNMTGAYLTEHLSFGKEDNLKLITASGLFVGMNIVCKKDSSFVKEEIVSIEKIDGTFYDLEVEDTNNFIGNNILSHNSVYAWRASDDTVIEDIKKQDKTKVLSLPISYRCPKKIIELAKHWVPDITCPDTAIDGQVMDISLNEIYKIAKPGCFILSRTNAPLIKLCMKFISLGIKANIKGRDIGKQLNYLIKKSKKKQIPAFLKWLESWKNDELVKLKEKNINPENVLDRFECLSNLCEEQSSLEEVSKRIDELFNDTDESNIIILSSVHRSKGLEREDVFVLRWTFRLWLEESLSLIEKPNEEANIAYVAATRSKKNLYIVNKF